MKPIYDLEVAQSTLYILLVSPYQKTPHLFFIGKLHTHTVGGLEPTISPSILVLQGEKKSFELKLIGHINPHLKYH